jgi:ribonucleoside-diphosphate reductase alpha chain
VSFMHYFDAVGLGVHSSGHRRGAQMAVLRVDHPDIEEFVSAKQWTRAQNAIWRAAEALPAKARADVFAALQDFNPLQGFNISVGVTDAFMEAVDADALFALSFGGREYREVRALDLWQKIMRATWDWAEPGVLFVDTVNRMNNLRYCETIVATNPCGEQPLPPFGACLLGSFNLPKYLTRQPDGSYAFDFDQLVADVPAVVRGMDNVNDRTHYPLPLQERDARTKRRMGLGVMGLANAGEALGHPYGSPGFLDFESRVMQTIRDETYRASAAIAIEKGPFALYDERYLQGEFVRNLPDDVQAAIRAGGIRNSHLTSVAPTGTISLCADNVSSGVEPVFAYEVERPIQTPQGRVSVRVGDYGVDFLGVRGKRSADVTPREHVDVLLTAQRYVDSAVSKTCNVTGETPWEEFVGIYSQVHAGGGKGCTTFNRDGKRMGLLTAGGPGPITADDGPSCAVDENGVRSCD